MIEQKLSREIRAISGKFDSGIVRTTFSGIESNFRSLLVTSKISNSKAEADILNLIEGSLMVSEPITNYPDLLRHFADLRGYVDQTIYNECSFKDENHIKYADQVEFYMSNLSAKLNRI